MKVKIIVIAGLVVAYIASMLVGFFTVTQKEPMFPVPEYIKLLTVNDENLIYLYEEKGKYYIEYPDEEYELTREEYLRLACINPDNFDVFEDQGSIKKPEPGTLAEMRLEIKYPDDKKAKEYVIIFNETFHNPCWQMLFFRSVRINTLEGRDDIFTLNCALQETFDAYDVERGSGMCNSDGKMRTVFFYGDSVEQLISEEDCFDEDIYYQVMGEIVMYDLYEEGEIDAKDLTNDYDKMCDLIKDVTGDSLKKVIQERYNSSMIPAHNSKKKVFISELYISLFHLRPGIEIFLEEDSQQEILDKYYTYTDKYESEGYYRVFTNDDQIVIVCLSNEDKIAAAIVAEGVDPLVRKQFINDVVETVFDQKEEGVKGHPAIMAHRIFRAVVTTVIFVVLLVAVLVLFAVLKKFKKSAIAVENAVAEAPKTIIEPAPIVSAPVEAPAEQAPQLIESDSNQPTTEE